MLDLNLIREKTDYVKEALAKKGWNVDFTELLAKVGLGAATTGTQACMFWFTDEPKMPKCLIEK